MATTLRHPFMRQADESKGCSSSAGEELTDVVRATWRLRDDSVVEPPGGAPGTPRSEGQDPGRTDPLELLGFLGPSFARTGAFWLGVLFAVLQGGVLGGVALAFFNSFDKLSEYIWKTDNYTRSLDAGAPQGDWLWVAFGAGGGLGIGAFKVLYSALICTFPDDPPGLIGEIKDLECHQPSLAPAVLIVSAASLALGASVGPEAAMGTCGAALGTVLARLAQCCRRDFGDDGCCGRCWRCCRGGGGAAGEDTPPVDTEHGEGENAIPGGLLPDGSQDQLYTMTGMAAAMGALLPSPILSVMIIHELSIVSGPLRFHFMESVVQMGIAATVSYVLFVGLEDYTFLKQLTLPLAASDIIHIEGFKMWYVAVGVPLGIVSGVIGFIGILGLGLGKKLGQGTRDRLNGVGRRCGLPRFFLGTLLSPAIGGALVTLLGVACPLTLGDGNVQLKAVVMAGVPGRGSNSTHLDANTLLGTCFAKILALGLSLGFGFVGGQIFPLIFAGTCAGVAAHLLVEGLPVLIAVPAMLVAVPCSFVPAPFALVGTTIMLLGLGPEVASTVFVAAFSSFTTVCGGGIIQRMILRAAGRGKTVSN